MSVRLRRWHWKEMPPYNGFTHAERVRGWQVQCWMIDTGQMEKATTCCITGSTQRVSYHSEDYYSWEVYPLCQTVHFALHQRFERPNAWRKIVDQYRNKDDWFDQLLLAPIDLASELRDQHGALISDIFNRAVVPKQLWEDLT